ncbi:MAG TPA: GNAT family protein [Gemmatimonadales bacterium]|nr:GNAT family protein [Gemmatimonadales bacterium]
MSGEAAGAGSREAWRAGAAAAWAAPRKTPELRTDRLVIGQLVPEDAPAIVRLAGAREIADTTLSVPHPYEMRHAREFIAFAAHESAEGTGLHLAIRLAEGGGLIGAIGLKGMDGEHRVAELGYWIGTEWWGRGYATEATGALVRHAFDELGLNRLQAHHMVRNPASGRVLEKAGFRREGVLRERVYRWGRFEDVVVYGILRSDLADGA